MLDRLFEILPRPPCSDEETEEAATKVYDYVWERSVGGSLFGGTEAA